jgi:Tfp pilus assembly protein PilP
MKLTTGILVMMMAGGAWAQNPTIIQNTQDKMNAVQQQKVADSNAALGVSQPQAKPSPAGPVSTGSKPAPSKAATKPPASKAAPAKPAASAAPAPKTGTVPAATPKTVTMPSAPGAANAAAPVAKKAAAPKTAEKKATAKPIAVIVPKAAKSGKKGQPKSVVQAQTKPAEKPQEKEKRYSMVGKRDPFVSPVVNHMGGSGCNTGKKCLEIGQINLKGVVRADTGMIAVVTNSMNKAYFLRENDPVFNGYVEKITTDSIVFKETFQDKLGKSLTRDVVKKILTPAV